MPEIPKETRQPRHYTAEEFRLVANLDPEEARKWLEKEGLTPGSGTVEVFIDDKPRLISTDPVDFGTLVLEEKSSKP